MGRRARLRRRVGSSVCISFTSSRSLDLEFDEVFRVRMVLICLVWNRQTDGRIAFEGATEARPRRRRRARRRRDKRCAETVCRGVEWKVSSNAFARGACTLATWCMHTSCTKAGVFSQALCSYIIHALKHIEAVPCQLVLSTTIHVAISTSPSSC